MANEWYAQLMGEQIGPLSDDGLRELVAKRQLTPDDMVRKSTSANWVPASNVRGLFQESAGFGATTAPTESTGMRTDSPIGTGQAAVPQNPHVEGWESGHSTPTSTRPSLFSTFWRSQWRIATILAFAGFGVGFLLGREHVKYQIRSTFAQMGKAFEDAFQQKDSGDFHAALTAFAAEGKKMKNLIEMGAPEMDRRMQMVRVRAMAELTPGNSDEQAIAAIGHKLIDRLAAYSANLNILASQRSFSRKESQQTRKMIETNNKLLAYYQDEFQKLAQEINTLLANITESKPK